MNLASPWVHAGTALLAATAGWSLHAGGSAPQVATVPVVKTTGAAPAQPAKAGAERTLIAVSADGQVTLRVEQQPLDWVLEQIAQQSGWADVRERARPAARPLEASAKAAGAPADETEAVCFDSAGARPADAARTMAAIERGSESDRFDGLLQARADSLVVPSTTLKSIYETDASESVRLLAFETWLEANADRRDAVRDALDAALLLPSAAVQREARRRLDELNESERVDASDPQPAVP
jgi:hypothetical protein